MKKIFIDGEAGTTGLQIRDRLAGRSDLELIHLDDARRKDAGARADALNAADVAILCLPDDAAREAVALVEGADTRIIDASTAHRTADGWAYGFPEMSGDQPDAIAGARYVANPGCWPQGFIAMARPLVAAGLLPADTPLTYSGVSGYSGGGRKMIEAYEAMGRDAAPFVPYGLTLEHKHIPEMKVFSGLDSAPVFLPAVVPVAQGMLATLPLSRSQLAGEATAQRVHEALCDHYGSMAGSGGFVKVAPLMAMERHDSLDPRELNGSNEMRLHVFTNAATGHMLLMAIYDNLGKGASGAAVQNLNLMLGADAATGLEAA